MNIGIVGLNLFGASFAKAIKAKTDSFVLGTDASCEKISKAKHLQLIDDELTGDNISTCEYILVALHPKDATAFVRSNAAKIKKGAVVIDCCGIKQVIVGALVPIARKYGFTFIGGHVMVGKEHPCVEFSFNEVFGIASMVLTPEPHTDVMLLKKVKAFFKELGFSKILFTTPEAHDRLIAHTTQFTHTLSNPRIEPSFYDSSLPASGMSGSALTSEPKWNSTLSPCDAKLAAQTDDLIRRLKEYSVIIKKIDLAHLKELLRKEAAQKAHRETQEHEVCNPSPSTTNIKST